MVPIRVFVSALALLSVLLLLTGCRLLFGGSFEMPEDMPSDFTFHLERQGARSPDVNYLYKFERNGSVDYWVKAPSASARPNEGTFQISGNDVIALYDEIRAAGIGGYQPIETLSDAVPDVTFYVLSNGRGKRLTFKSNEVPPALVSLREAVFNFVPPEYRTAEAPPDGPDGPPERFVGDASTKIFYASDAEQLKKVPPERRVFFATAYEALDHGFYPDPESQPMKRVKDPK